jgi:hypothetical protein
MAHDVFISYAHEDKPVADALCATLEARKIRCWMAPRDIAPGAEWAGAISDAIGHSSVFVLIFSDFSNRSQQVIREVGLAVSREVVVIPLRLENVALSSTMEYFVSTCHWLDALSPPLQAHLNRLTSRVQALLQQEPSSEAVSLSPEPVASPGETDQRPGALNLQGPRAWLVATTARLRRFCTRMIERVRATLRGPDLGSHAASPSQPATPLDAAAYKAAIQRRLDARKQHRKARLAIGAATLVVVFALASALSFGLKAHQRGAAAGTGAPGVAPSGAVADTGRLTPAQGEPAADTPGADPAQGEPAADAGAPGPAQGEPAASAGGTGPTQGGTTGQSGGGSAANAAPVSQPPRIRSGPTPAEATAQRELCQSQLKSLARASLMYCMDYDEVLPRANWAPAIYPYAMRNDELYQCPLVPANGYALNSKALGRTMAMFEHPAQTALLFDSSALGPSAVADTSGVAYRHLLGDQPGANVAFAAGNVRWCATGTVPQ